MGWRLTPSLSSKEYLHPPEKPLTDKTDPPIFSFFPEIEGATVQPAPIGDSLK
jgi:hypothetical protein